MNPYRPGVRVVVDDSETTTHGTLTELTAYELAARRAENPFVECWCRALAVDLDDGRRMTIIEPALSQKVTLLEERHLRAVT